MIPTTGVANRGVGLEWVAAAGSTDVPCVAVAGGAIEAAGTADDAGVAGVAFATVSTAVAGASIVAGATAEADAAGSSSSDGAESTTESGTRSAGTGGHAGLHEVEFSRVPRLFLWFAAIRSLVTTRHVGCLGETTVSSNLSFITLSH